MELGGVLEVFFFGIILERPEDADFPATTTRQRRDQCGTVYTIMRERIAQKFAQRFGKLGFLPWQHFSGNGYMYRHIKILRQIYREKGLRDW